MAMGNMGWESMMMMKCRCENMENNGEKRRMFDLKSYWKTLIEEVNEKLEEAIPEKYPNRIYKAMRYSLLSSSAKRAPPVLCIATSDLFSAPRIASFPTACALEMVHVASLIHDDLPCMDDDTSRRGQPSNHMVHGVDMAVLSGDALFPLGFHHILSRTPSALVPHDRILRLITEIARAVGSRGMAAGQLLDLEGRPDNVEFVHAKKFGEMSECSAVCGALIGAADDADIERLRRYGRAVGVLYQVVDDILQGDEGRNKRSYVRTLGVRRAVEAAEELREEALEALRTFVPRYGDKVMPLRGFVEYAFDRDFAV